MYIGRESYFLTIAETQNLTKAAQILHVSQPSLAFFGLMSYYVVQMVVQYIIDGTTQSTSSTPAWILPFGCAIGMVVITVVAIRNIVLNLSEMTKGTNK